MNAFLFWLPRGNTIEESVQVCRWIEEAGAAFYKDTIAGVKTGLDEARSAAGKRKRGPFVTAGK